MRVAPIRRRCLRPPGASLGALALLTLLAPRGLAQTAADPSLEIFRAWLDREHRGYGCDEGPARLRNKTVEAAYPNQRFYYVLTYTRGIPPPFPNSLSVVAAVDDSGRVVPFSWRSPETYGRGLIRVSSTKDAKLAAAAISIVGTCDPGERRWAYKPERFKVKRSSKGWKCTYHYDPNFSSWVAFDRKGAFLEFGGTAPPVP
jgi:hypothetical protein